MKDIPHIAWIGTGYLGSAVVTKLSSMNVLVTIYNRTRSRAEHLTKLDNVFFEGNIEAVSDNSEMIFICVSDDEATKNVLYQILRSLKPGKIIANMATISPNSSNLLRQKCLTYGVEYVECPVTGGAESAENGVLTCYISGSISAVLQIQSVLSFVCKSIHVVGTACEAQIVKIINNQMEAVNLWGAAEALCCSKRAGLDLKLVADAFLSGRGSSRYLSVLLNSISGESGKEKSRVGYDIRLKDINLAKGIINEVGAYNPLTLKVQELYAGHKNLLSNDSDQTDIFVFFF